MVAGQDVDYRLFRARRSSIGMVIDHNGLVVRAPRWVALREIELALIERADWVIKTLAEWRGKNRDSLPTEWRAGAALLYQGRPLTLALFPARRKASPPIFASDGAASGPGRRNRDRGCRTLAQGPGAGTAAPRVAHFASLVATSSPTVRLSSARTQWGSCNQKGEIRLHWRLVQLPPRIADYVVAHEVAHLVELNHSPRFWALLETLLPGHDDARRELDALTPLLG